MVGVPCWRLSHGLDPGDTAEGTCRRPSRRKAQALHHTRPLIIEEIGYLPIDGLDANLFLQLISRRYERGPMIMTSNQSSAARGDVFGDGVIATAILDRLLHHAVTLNMRGNSYRLKEKRKAGLVRAQGTLA